MLKDSLRSITAICLALTLTVCTMPEKQGTITVNQFSITASSPSPTSIYIKWETEAAIKNYKLYRQSMDMEEYEGLAAKNNDNSYLDTGLQPSTKYSYKIAYIDNNTERFIGDGFFAITQPHLIAHRGYYWYVDSYVDGSAQNSIKSLQLAAELGVYGSEFDVHLTADNIPVIYHNTDIKGTNIAIQLVPYDTIKDVILLNGEKLPTLDDYLEASKTLHIQLILELKSHATPERDREAAQIVVEKVKNFGLEDKVEYITYSLEAGKELIRLQPDSNVGYLGGNYLTPTELKEYGFSTHAFFFEEIQSHPEYFFWSKELGLITVVFPVNMFSLMENMINYGASLIITDIPMQAKEYLEQKEWKYSF